MLKWIGAVLLAGAIGVLISDALGSGDEGGFVLSSLGEWWFWAHKDSLLLLQPAIERHVSQHLFDPYILTLLEWSLAAQLAVLGLVLMGLGRIFRRRRD